MHALTADPSLMMVRAAYERPLGDQPGEGGRVTELTARPALALLFPTLAHLRQPLAGEVAIRRGALERVPFIDGYGVDVGLLLDIAARYGADAIGEVSIARARPPQPTDAPTQADGRRSAARDPQPRRRRHRRPAAARAAADHGGPGYDRRRRPALTCGGRHRGSPSTWWRHTCAPMMRSAAVTGTASSSPKNPPIVPAGEQRQHHGRRVQCDGALHDLRRDEVIVDLLHAGHDGDDQQRLYGLPVVNAMITPGTPPIHGPMSGTMLNSPAIMPTMNANLQADDRQSDRAQACRRSERPRVARGSSRRARG